MTTLPASFPELMLLLALVASVFVWDVIKLLLTALAVGFVLLVMLGMAGYGMFHVVVG